MLTFLDWPAGKAMSFNDLHICDVSSPEESKWSLMQADNPPPSRARHAAVVVSCSFCSNLLTDRLF